MIQLVKDTSVRVARRACRLALFGLLGLSLGSEA